MHLLRYLRRGESRLPLPQLRWRAGPPAVAHRRSSTAAASLDDTRAERETVRAGAVAEQIWPQKAQEAQKVPGIATARGRRDPGWQLVSIESRARERDFTRATCAFCASLRPRLRRERPREGGRKRRTPRTARCCRGRDLNPYSLRNQILSLARLPFRHLGGSVAGQARPGGDASCPRWKPDLTGRLPKLPPDDCCRHPC